MALTPKDELETVIVKAKSCSYTNVYSSVTDVPPGQTWALTSLEGVDAVFVLAGQDHHRPAELAAPEHLPTSRHSRRTGTSPEPLHRTQHPLVRGHATPRAVPRSRASLD